MHPCLNLSHHSLSGRQDSNLQPNAPKAFHLPIEILPDILLTTCKDSNLNPPDSYSGALPIWASDRFFVETVGLEPTSTVLQTAALTISATFPFHLSGRPDSNWQPFAYKATALTVELHPKIFAEDIGIEPWHFCPLKSSCAELIFFNCHMLHSFEYFNSNCQTNGSSLVVHHCTLSSIFHLRNPKQNLR